MTAQLAPLYQRWRPISFDEVIGQPRAIKVIRHLQETSGLAGQAYWICGPSGTGKSTIAKLIAADIADEMNVDEIDAGDLSGAAIRELERGLRCYGLGAKNGRAIVINEAHRLNAPARAQLLTTLERIPLHAAWLFTTTDEGEQKMLEGIDTDAFLSRCVELPMSRRGLCEAMAKRALEIAQAENLDGRPLSQYIELMKQCRNNMRRALGEIEVGAMLPE